MDRCFVSGYLDILLNFALLHFNHSLAFVQLNSQGPNTHALSLISSSVFICLE